MAKSLCESCMWSGQCSEQNGCEYYDPLQDDYSCAENLYNRIEYEYEWQTYIACWNGNDKWGDLYDA